MKGLVPFSVALPPQKIQGLLGTGSLGRPPRLSFTQLLSCEGVGSVQCCFASTENSGLIGDRESGTATSTFTALEL